ncbi:UDP-glucose--hexose-1-phosphate uridylyltransferase, partial [Bifidobacterium longum]|nr:UDP-glucose--hexose-1-phosphate uridylyltransferase [Bifidobacterium longum]
HLPWAKEVQARHDDINADNVEEILEQEVAQVFGDVLADAGVFKRNAQGQAGWQRFVERL